MYLNLDLIYNISEYFVYPVLSYYKLKTRKNNYISIFHNYTSRMIIMDDFNEFEYFKNEGEYSSCMVSNFLETNKEIKGFEIPEYLLKFLSTM